MYKTIIKTIAAVGVIAAIGVATVQARSCSCSRGAGGTTYCSCR